MSRILCRFVSYSCGGGEAGTNASAAFESSGFFSGSGMQKQGDKTRHSLEMIHAYGWGLHANKTTDSTLASIELQRTLTPCSIMGLRDMSQT
jgi:hypothetical protein